MAPGDLSAGDVEGIRSGVIGDPTVRRVAALAAGVGDRTSVRKFRRRQFSSSVREPGLYPLDFAAAAAPSMQAVVSSRCNRTRMFV
jgi:hypothetical protein